MPETEHPNATDLPGYRRRLCVEAGEGAVLAMLEDDFHCMAVILRHDGEAVQAVESVTHRMPWNTCPGAAAKLVQTFEGLPLRDVTARRDKKQNCTHLHDLAVLSAAHAGEEGPLVYDIFASDPVEGERVLEIRRNGLLVQRWIEKGGVIASPAEAAGLQLIGMRDWIASLSGPEREAARLLQWGALVAHGRTMPIAEQSEAAKLPANCYTLQPERAAQATRNGERIDFSRAGREPLDGFAERVRPMLNRRAG